jgi:phosphatidate cytidylyltransferase
MASNKTVRVIVAAIGIPVAAAVVYAGGWVLVALLAVLGAVGASEMYTFGAAAGLRPARVLGMAAAALAPVGVYAVLPGGVGVAPAWFVFAGVAWFILTTSTIAATRSAQERPLGSTAVTVLGVLYAGLLPGFLLSVRHAPGTPSALAGTVLVFLPLATVWACDSLAMEVGSRVGGPKLAPVLSPKKTWSGAIGGTLGGMLAAPLFGFLAFERVGLAIPWWQLALFGLVASIIGQIGDVTESAFKREVGIKDSGGFFPGHGGVLDRLDSLYWVLPTAALFLQVVGVQ